MAAKRFTMKLKFFYTCLTLFFLIAGCSKPPDRFVASPSGNNAIQFQMKNEEMLSYTVTHHSDTIIQKSRLGFDLRRKGLNPPFHLLSISHTSHGETWTPVWGEDSVVRNEYNEMVVHLENKEGKMNIYFRAYDDGVAFRYEILNISGADSVFIQSENTEFNLAKNGTTWWIPADFDNYEYLHRTTKTSEIEAANTPVTFKQNDSLYISLHEANLTNYAGMTLQKSDSTPLTANLVPWPDGIKVKAKLPLFSPWRTIQIAENPGALIESKMIVNLNEPNKLEDVSWIKPSVYMGIWWGMHIGKETWHAGSKHGATTENAKTHIDFCSANQIPALLIEGWNTGWEHWGKKGAFDLVTPYDDFNFEEVIAYARKRGVSIIGHHETGGDVEMYNKNIDTAFSLYRSLGIHTVKTGYAGMIQPRGQHHHGQWMVNHYRKVVEKAATAQIMIDAHEPIKATGLRRTYPNMMTREGVRGMEYNAWGGGNDPEHTTILPFTRMLAGPLDYTPGIFDLKFEEYEDKDRVFSTLANQLALYVVLYSPLQMAADLPENYDRHPAFDFIKNIPTDWDESRVLGAEIGDYVTVARRNGEDWYLGAITDENFRKLNIPLNFLESGKSYIASIYCDAIDTDWEKKPQALEIGFFETKASETLTTVLSNAGGTAVHFCPKPEEEAAWNPPPLKMFHVQNPRKLQTYKTLNVFKKKIEEKKAMSGEKGQYFAKKKYETVALPTFEESKHRLPVPLVSDNREWINLYWFCWKLAFQNLRQPKPGSHLVSNYVDETFNENIFQWDTHFMLHFWKYAHHIFNAVESHDNFYCRQHDDGYICREIEEATGEDFIFMGEENTINPPLFAWAEFEFYQFSKDYGRLKSIFPALEKYTEWLEKNRHVKGMADGLFWNTNLGSGMDNSPRDAAAWVDMTAQIAMHYYYLSFIAQEIWEVEEAAKYYARFEAIKRQTNSNFWDDETGFYFDLDSKNEFVKTKTIAGFWPMATFISEQEHVEKMFNLLGDPEHFNSVVPFSSLSQDEAAFDPTGDYWKGGVWAPTNYMLMKGLVDNSLHEFAHLSSVRFLNHIYQIYKETGTIWENYSPTETSPGNPAKPGFVGWSGLGPITIFIENIIGIRVGTKDRVYWNVLRTDEHGIRNLTIGENQVSLICKARNSQTDTLMISVETGQFFTLVVKRGEKEHSFEIKPGRHTVVF